jgi:hypothetical protein
MTLVFGTSSLYSRVEYVPTQAKTHTPPTPTKSPNIDDGCHTSQNRVTSPHVVFDASVEPHSQTVPDKAISRLRNFMDNLVPGTSIVGTLIISCILECSIIDIGDIICDLPNIPRQTEATFANESGT